MAIDKLELLEQVTDKWATTNAIAKRINANWHIIFGMLSMLYKDGYVDYQEVQLSGNKKATLWRKKQND